MEKVIRELVPSAEKVYFRPVNNFLDLSFSEQSDFVTAVMCAASANIRCEVIATFKGKLAKHKPINSCVLRLELGSNCVDVRLVTFLYELFNIVTTSEGSCVHAEDLDRFRAQAREYERDIQPQHGH